jgi:FMN-dependent NADH-azoreductase
MPQFHISRPLCLKSIAVNELQRRNPGTTVVVRDLGKSPPPHVGQAFITGMYAAPEQRTPEQAKTFALSDVLIDELFAADTIDHGRADAQLRAPFDAQGVD